MGKTGGGGRRGRLAIAAPEIRISESEARAFRGAPEEHIAMISYVERDPYLGAATVGEYDRHRPGVITLKPGIRGATARHELGHLVWFQAMNPSEQRTILDEFKARPRSVSTYGAMNVREHWAEMYMLWTNPGTGGVKQRARVRRQAPAAAEYLEVITGRA